MIPSQIKVCVVHIWGEGADHLLHAFCTDADRALAALHRSPLRQRQSLVSRAKLRQILTQERSADKENWTLSSDSLGRPSLTSHDGSPVPDISLSHSGPWAGVAVVREGRVGLDLECRHSAHDITGIAATFLSPQEQLVLEAEGETAFFDFWTLREAFGKAKGEGLNDGLSQDQALTQAVLSARDTTLACFIHGQNWLMSNHRTTDYSLAVAWQGGRGPISIDVTR